MAHNQRIAPDAAYSEGAPLPNAGAWYGALDTAQQNALNGDAGGTWAPATGIVLQVQTASQTRPVLRVEGPLTLTHGIFQNGFGFGKRIVLGSGVPQFVPSRSRTIMTSCGRFVDVNGLGDKGAAAASMAVPHYNQVADSLSSSRVGMHVMFPLDRVHDGSTLQSVQINATIVSGHSAITSIAFPRIRVVRFDAFGNVFPIVPSSIATTFGGAFASLGSGWATLGAPGSVGAYNGANIFIEVIINTVIDRSQYTYALELVDEYGANALPGNLFFSIASVCSIPDARFQ